MVPEMDPLRSRTNSYEVADESPLTADGSLLQVIQKHQHQKHQRFVVADPLAFRYLEEDRSTTVLARERDLEGYQIYLIEQWACSRTHPTFIIAAFTGNAAHTVRVGVLSVPADEEAWSPRLRVYFKTLGQYYARRKETPLGILMVTNLSGFPSSLTIVPVPDGDVYKHREVFFVNENLKRLGCSGRVGLTITEPSSATQAKFYQLYKVSEKIPLYSSVIELVKLCQAALMLFGCLEAEYVDGLFCDFTEKGINDWWARIGGELYNVEPSDGMLGPTTVAGLLGTLIGARNRLNAYGAPVAKDVFDLESTKRAISHFQKAQRISQSRRLDSSTINRLHSSTAKQASGEGWYVPRAVKSTVAELSGKSGEMVMDIVGRGEKITIADIETVDIDRFASLVKGERAKWLWHGKARKRTTRDLFSGTLGEDQLVSRSKPESGDHPASATSESPRPRRDVERSRSTEEGSELDFPAKGTMLERAKGRIKGAVGKRGHTPTASKDSHMFFGATNKSMESFGTASTEEPLSPGSNRGDDFHDEPHDAYGEGPKTKTRENTPTFTDSFTHTPIRSQRTFPPKSAIDEADSQDEQHAEDPSLKPRPEVSQSAKKQAVLRETFLPQETLEPAEEEKPANPIGLLLQRTQSFSQIERISTSPRNDARWPRQLSFSATEDSILAPPAPTTSSTRPTNPRQHLVQERLRAAEARRLRDSIAALGADIAVWVEGKIDGVEGLNTLATQDVNQLHALYYPRRDEYHALQEGSREILSEEKGRLAETVKELETLGAKMEYEIGALRGKVEDVEEAVGEFEMQVGDTERRVGELIRESGKEGWFGWVVRSLMRGERQTVLGG